MTTPTHVPVLAQRVLDVFSPTVDAAVEAGRTPVLVDTTLGLGGHSELMLQRFDTARVIGIDRDPHARRLSAARLAPFADRFALVGAVYDEISEAVTSNGESAVDGVLFDLGVSSMQLDETERGFAYSQDSPLDMRMDAEGPLTAAEILNTYDAADLSRILREYGEEKFARRIADAVVRERENEPFTRSARLVDLIRDNIPAAARRTGGNPAKRTFQALRIEVNDELRVYERALAAALDLLVVGGRIVVLSYHSLEDRITKRAFASVTKTHVPRDLPMVPKEHAPKFRLVTRGAEQASEHEIIENPRAASVRMRVAERTVRA